ncbi:MAG: glycosyltransferase family 4 protein [Lachnospiraceae bacterium]
MRVLWVCNISIMQTKKNVYAWCGGWMTATAELLAERTDIELVVCYPQSESETLLEQKRGKIQYCGFYVVDRNEYNAELEKVFGRINRKYTPDIVHIFGTEFPHSLPAVRVWKEKAVISIQGLIGVYAKHYFTGIPAKIVYRQNFGGGSIYKGMLGLRKRGKYEYKAIQCARNIIGRTDWDYACIQLIHSNVSYFNCNEILRDCFYSGEWEYSQCKKHSILISQADYPVKGFHIFLRALKLIKKKYSDVEVIVAGCPLGIEQKEWDSYANYILGLLEKWHLRKNVRFIGTQSDQKMKEQFLRAHVFVLPSLIENSPNSLGEAMLLGVPCVASDVGGVGSLMRHGEEGFVYQVDAEYMLAYYVEKIFEDPRLAEKFSVNARKHAKITHDRESNLKELLGIYKKVLG